MSDLDRGITNLRKRLTEDELSEATRNAMVFALRSMEIEKEKREIHPNCSSIGRAESYEIPTNSNDSTSWL